MNENDFLASRFEADRPRLRQVAHRMLGSLTEADDALQESWLHVARRGAADIENFSGWLTTIVARVCLDMLRSRKSRREDPLDEPARTERAKTPEEEAVLADSVGVALLMVLDLLDPAERTAFVLHDLFGMSFDEIAPIVGRTSEATRQLASRARRRIHGAPEASAEKRTRERKVVEAFLVALRAGDMEGLVAVLHPDVMVHGDGQPELRGARNWAKGAVAFTHVARFVHVALVDGEIGVILAPHGKLSRALRFTVEGDQVTRVEIIADAARVAKVVLGVP